MTRATNLNDLQLILLATAAQRADGSVMPPTASIGKQAARISKAIPSLLKRELLKEVEVRAGDNAWRSDENVHYGLAITGAGRSIIAAGEGEESVGAQAAGDAKPQPLTNNAPTPAPISRVTKAMQVLELLRRAEGVTLDELIAATGWLPHTTRAALTGLRKKGHLIDRGKRNDATCYWILAAA